MAKILTEMPKRIGGPGRPSEYPYDEWLDGQIRQLEPGVDFQAKPQSVVQSARTMAEKRGMKLRSRLLTNDQKEVTAVVFQAYTEPVEVPAESNGHKDEVVETPVVQKSNRRPRTKQTA